MNFESDFLFLHAQSESSRSIYTNWEMIKRFNRANFVFKLDKVSNDSHYYILDKDRSNLWSDMMKEMYCWDIKTVGFQALKAILTSPKNWHTCEGHRFNPEMSEKMLSFIEFYTPDLMYDGTHVILTRNDVLTLTLIGVIA